MLSFGSDALRSPDVRRAVHQLPGHINDYECARVIKKKKEGVCTVCLTYSWCHIAHTDHVWCISTKFNKEYSMAAHAFASWQV